MTATEVPDQLLTASSDLVIRPRQSRWRSVAYCVTDAVWSIGARYDTVVAPLVRRVAAAAGDEQPMIEAAKTLTTPDPMPLPQFVERFPTVEELRRVTNNQRTSSRGGILKAEAVLRYCEKLINHQIFSLHDASDALADDSVTEKVTAELRRVPGDGVRAGYFWMLVGSDDRIKPDRQILKWLDLHGSPATPKQAKALLSGIASHLTDVTGQPVSPWQVDNAIWRSQAGSESTW